MPTPPTAEPQSRSHSGPTSTAASILLVEDDPAQSDALSSILTQRGYRVQRAADGATALELAGLSRPDMILLDLGLPDVDGITLCRHLRLLHDCAIIVVSGDLEEERMVDALDTGADDYVLKPYSTNQLLARMRVSLRHRQAAMVSGDTDLLRCGDLQLDVAGHQVMVGGDVIEMLPRQFELLTAMMRNQGRVMTYATLIRHLWGIEADGEHHALSLRTVISRVRTAIGVGPQRPAILTERHVGYRLVAPD